MSANGGVDHYSHPELNAMVSTADTFTQLVFLRQPLRIVVWGFPTVCIHGAACCSVDAVL